MEALKITEGEKVFSKAFAMLLSYYKKTILDDEVIDKKLVFNETIQIIDSYHDQILSGLIFNNASALKINDWNIEYMVRSPGYHNMPYFAGHLDRPSDVPSLNRTMALEDIPIRMVVPLMYKFIHHAFK